MSTLVILLSTGTINSKKLDNENNKNNNENQGFNLEILSIDKISIDKDLPNEKFFMTGKMNLSYDSSKFITTALTGYCIGKNNEKYTMHPGSRWIKYKDNETTFSLSNSITDKDVFYLDGSTKPAIEINWDEVEIKECVVDEFIGLTIDSQPITIKLNFKKEFNN